ncbi:sulfurtransferase TusA family protein [Thiomicrorhabdus sediminis]|uniref:Sulfurtransferase TusA family protein n=1 Tax=Thiomicrorhabdus sediminis TaxID=2580412 RepID=A0A4P9K5E8_9GAMM|nr:sulfurtransferase TusA family protein [Thiomicrorhabdus sediminis]QCU89476.1 sulfurtransferase TusA family protein [Thiomicrorhabdus sediminis]
MTENSEQIMRIDAKGLKCPMPVIKLQQQVRSCTKGSKICISCTDSGAEKDIASWVKVNKHIWLDCTATDYGCDICIEVAGRN